MPHPSTDPMLTIGLMSGTSADGVDAALVRTDGESQFEFLHSLTMAYDEDLRTRLLYGAQNEITLTDVLALERDLTDVHLAACQDLLAQSQPGAIQLIGFHGHTLRHDPSQSLTCQIGDAARLSHGIGCSVVSDFRRQDMANGGQGAPLAPLFHRQMLPADARPTLVLNLGGVANITWIGKQGELLAGDVGPGCGLLDLWAQQHLNQPFDRDGQLAQRGNVEQNLIGQFLRDPFFRLPMPKSADRFQFTLDQVQRLTAADGAATLCALTVAGVQAGVRMVTEQPESIWVTGGGVRHPVLMSMLKEALGNVQSIEAAGLRPDSLEAECFAWLAVRCVRKLSTSLPETTGCRAPTCGGSLT